MSVGHLCILQGLFSEIQNLSTVNRRKLQCQCDVMTWRCIEMAVCAVMLWRHMETGVCKHANIFITFTLHTSVSSLSMLSCTAPLSSSLHTSTVTQWAWSLWGGVQMWSSFTVVVNFVSDPSGSSRVLTCNKHNHKIIANNLLEAEITTKLSANQPKLLQRVRMEL